MTWDAREHSTPHSLFEASKRERAVEPSKRKNAGAELAHKAQVRLNTGAVLTNCHQISTLLSARAISLSRIGVPRVYTAAIIVGGRRKACPPSPADATLERQRKETQRVSGTSNPFASTTPRAETFLEPKTLSHRESVFFSWTVHGPFSFWQDQKENGGCRFPAPLRRDLPRRGRRITQTNSP